MSCILSVSISKLVQSLYMSSIKLEHYTVGTKPFQGTWLNTDMIQGQR